MHKDKKQGFSLIELSIVIVISGLLLSGIATSYYAYYSTYLYKQTFNKINSINSALSNYSAMNSRMPYPSAPALPLGDPNAGCECGVCGSGEAAACQYLEYTLPEGKCMPNGICKIAGATHTGVNPHAGPDPIYIGGIPYKTINQSVGAGLANAALQNTLDAWGYQINYAVSFASLSPATYGEGANGVIDIKTPDMINLDPAANYAIWSAGDNHMGAYTSDGIITVPCVPGEADYENCNNNYIFVTGLRSLVHNQYYFDDILYYSKYTLTQLWSFTAPGSSNIYNRNADYVGVGYPTGTPLGQELQVNGTLYSQGEIYVSNICDKGGKNCWAPNNFAGPASGTNASGNVCTAPAGQVRYVTELKDGSIKCSTSTIPVLAPSAGQSCPPGQFLVGFSSTGLICN